MPDLPYLQLWVLEHLGRTRHLSLEAHGALILLLLSTWNNPGCRIPDEPGWIQARLSVDKSAYNRVVVKVLNEFFEKENGYWSNSDLRRQYDRAVERGGALAEAGRKGGKATAKKTKGLRPSQATSPAAARLEPGSSMLAQDSIAIEASKPAALADRIRSVLGPGAASSALSGLETVAADWLGRGATADEIVEVVRRQTANSRPAPIRSLRALEEDILAAIANRKPALFPTRPAPQQAKLIMPEDPRARECVEAIIKKCGPATAQDWLPGAEWISDEVLVGSDYERQQFETRFGGTLRDHGYSVRIRLDQSLH